MATFNLTKKADYSLSMLSMLAAKGKGGKISLTELSEKGLPKAFMAQIANKLVQSGFLISKEGRGGGYELAVEPKMISLRRIFETIDGDLSPVTCVAHKGKCVMEENCWQRGFMLRFSHELTKLMDRYTLADLIGVNIGLNKKQK